ncbi:MAG: Nitrilase/cyanide hydratase and apolipoprotein N-acyltransferase, partial [uncultured Thermomicrobiales bacterium]
GRRVPDGQGGGRPGRAGLSGPRGVRGQGLSADRRGRLPRGAARGLPGDLAARLPGLARCRPRGRPLGSPAGQGRLRPARRQRRRGARPGHRCARRGGRPGRLRRRDGDQRARAPSPLRHPLQRHRHVRARRPSPRPAPQADPDLHRAPDLGAWRRQHPRRLRHPPRPGRWPGLLGALDAPGAPRHARDRGADPRRALADGPRPPPRRLSALCLRGALLRGGRRVRAPPRPGAGRPRGLPRRRARARRPPPRRGQRHHRARRPVPGRAGRPRGDHPLRRPRPRPHRRRAPHLRRGGPLRPSRRLHPDRQHRAPDPPRPRRRGDRLQRHL